jgi:hypothetical protein
MSALAVDLVCHYIRTISNGRRSRKRAASPVKFRVSGVTVQSPPEVRGSIL